MDTYTLKARWTPALISFAPLSLAALAWLSGDQAVWKEWGSILLATGVGVLITQLARKRGKDLEPKLFTQWGGKPTSRLLRSDSDSPEQAERWRSLLEEFSQIQLPNKEEELADPAKAERIFDVAVKKLIGARRDRKEFSLIFAENCNYGFWRNLVGLKPIGILFSVIGVIFAALPLVLLYHRNGDDFSKYSLSDASLPSIAVIVNLLVFLFWICQATTSSVRHAAEAYAMRLLESLES